MRFSENVIAAAVLLASSSNFVLAQQLPTASDIAKQQKQFNDAIGQVPNVAASPKLGTKMATGPVLVPAPNPEEVAKRYDKARQANRPKSPTDLMIFVSLSMPQEVIKELTRQSKQYGATLVLRGFQDDSMMQTEQIIQVLNTGGATWQVNPDAYKQFRVQTVPTFVLATAGATSILEEGCARPANYVSLNGNQSIDVALQTIKRRSANVYLANDAAKRLASNNKIGAF